MVIELACSPDNLFRKTATQGWEDSSAARRIIKESHERFMEQEATTAS